MLMRGSVTPRRQRTFLLMRYSALNTKLSRFSTLCASGARFFTSTTLRGCGAPLTESDRDDSDDSDRAPLFVR